MTENDHILRGFNAAYQLHKLDPSFAKFVQNTLTQSVHPYAQGFLAGGKRYQQEQLLTPTKDKPGFHQKMQARLKQQSPKSKKKGKSPEL